MRLDRNLLQILLDGLEAKKEAVENHIRIIKAAMRKKGTKKRAYHRRLATN